MDSSVPLRCWVGYCWWYAVPVSPFLLLTVPQLDKFIFMSQFLWLFLLLALGYYGLVVLVLPRLLAALKLRRVRAGLLRADLATMERLQQQQRSVLYRRFGLWARLWTATASASAGAIALRRRTAETVAVSAARGCVFLVGRRSGHRSAPVPLPVGPVRSPLPVGLPPVAVPLVQPLPSPHWTPPRTGSLWVGASPLMALAVRRLQVQLLYGELLQGLDPWTGPAAVSPPFRLL